MNVSPFYNPSSNESPREIGDEVQEELDRHAAFLRASGISYSAPAPQPHYAMEASALMGALLGPLVYVVLVLASQRFFAPELFGDREYKFLLLGSLPYALMWGGYVGARLPVVVSSASWRSARAWLGFIACVGAMVLLGSFSPVARLYMPLYALPFASILWVELAVRHSK